MSRRIRAALPGTAALLLVAVLGLLAGCTGATGPAGSARSLDAGLAGIPHRSVAPMPQARLASHLVPPTNRWFSGLVFGEAPQPVFPLPLSFGLTGSGFAFGVPKVTSGTDTITGGFTPSISVDAGAASSMIVAYDAASVTIAQKNAHGDTIGTVVIAEGSPVVSFTAQRDGTVTLGTPFVGSGRVRSATVGGTGYGLVTESRLSGARLSLKAGQTAEFFAAPSGVDPVRLGDRVSALTGVEVGYHVGPERVSTTLSYHSTGPTLVAAMPHQQAGLTAPHSCSLGSYPSVYGSLTLCAGSELSWTSPNLEPDSSLKLDGISSHDRSELKTQLAQDVASTSTAPTDSYYGGKALYRLANLLTLAHELGARSDARTLQSKLEATLVKWSQPKGCAQRATECFVYDPKANGMVGLKASFGSEQFNDHAFHYGYFLYAAGVAARYDSSLIPKLQPTMELLAADIANPNDSSAFPIRRGFDAYAGHSWASGYAPFADGNNQESSSEAVDAWNGLGLWAAAIGNDRLATEARWMLSAEAASARAYWTDFDTRDPVYSGYQHSVVGINWGGKRDNATWFSADANAKLGIQLIPMSPVSHYLAGDPGRIARNIAEATPSGMNVQFGDYLLMYSALEGGQQASAALATARTLSPKFIDDADSRSYLLAWIMSRQ